MQKEYARRICCICMSILFLMGIFGQTNHIKQNPFAVQSKAESMDAREMASYRPVEALTGIDDFHITADAGRTLSGSYAGVRGVTLWIAVLILLLFFGSIPPKRRICLRKKRILVFRIVTFIHRTDGKKKSCFDFTKGIKTGGRLKWKLVQSIKFCLLMKKRKCSII